jgi:hypothetical protein
MKSNVINHQYTRQVFHGAGYVNALGDAWFNFGFIVEVRIIFPIVLYYFISILPQSNVEK